MNKNCVLFWILLIGYCGMVNAGENSSMTVFSTLMPEDAKSPKPEVIQQDAEIYKLTFPEEIGFEFDSDQLSNQAREILSQIAEKLKSHLEIRLRVEGNGDDVGSNVYNIQLGLRRSQSVINYLVHQHGIPRYRLIKTSLGEENQGAETPADDIETKRKKNRVVRFNIEGGWYVFTQPKTDVPTMNNALRTGLPEFQLNTPVYQFPLLNLQPPTILSAVDRKWTLKQRVLVSTIVGLVTSAGSSYVTWLRDVHNEDIRTSTGGHYETYRNIDGPEVIAAGAGFVGGVAGTFWFSGHFWHGTDGSFKVKFETKGGAQ